MREKLYNQKLSPEQAAYGISLAIENARSLLADAELLKANHRFERAVALAILAIEEAGKTSIIRSILLEDDAKELKIQWQNYRKHTHKNMLWILPDLVRKGSRHLDQMYPMVDPSSDHGKTLDSVKQLAFYTDAFNPLKWSTPKDVSDKNLADSLIKLAGILVRGNKAMTTAPELELWIKHMKPLRRMDLTQMKKGLVACYKEAEAMGLIEKGLANRMVDFAR